MTTKKRSVGDRWVRVKLRFGRLYPPARKPVVAQARRDQQCRLCGHTCCRGVVCAHWRGFGAAHLSCVQLADLRRDADELFRPLTEADLEART